jgi:hypothetical protein
MRQIDNMTSSEIETLRLKGMLAQKLAKPLPLPLCNCTPREPMKWSNEDECYYCDECEATAH